jgi:ankyrin repeat protein
MEKARSPIRAAAHLNFEKKAMNNLFVELLRKGQEKEALDLVAQCDLKKKDGWGVTLLMRAAMESSELSIVQRLMPLSDQKARDKDKETLLMWAAKNDQCAKMVYFFLPNSDPLAVSKSGQTALTLAIRWGHPDAVKALLPLSDLAHRDSEGRNAMDWAVEEKKRHFALAIEEELARRAAVHEREELLAATEGGAQEPRADASLDALSERASDREPPTRRPRAL